VRSGPPEEIAHLGADHCGFGIEEAMAEKTTSLVERLSRAKGEAAVDPL
jgi:hypothetical protein